MRDKLRVMMAVVFLLSFSRAAYSSSVAMSFLGVVDQATDESGLIGDKVHPGDKIEGSIIFDSDSSVARVYTSATGETQYFFDTPPYGMNVTIGSLSFHTVPIERYDSDFLLQVSRNQQDGEASTGGDSLIFVSYGTETNAHSVSGVLFIQLDLVNMQGGVLSDESLPDAAPISSDWPLKLFSIHYYPDSPNSPAAYEILGTISHVGESNTVPLADAGRDQVVFGKVTLDGSRSYDPDGKIVSHTWILHHRGDSANDRHAEGVSPTISHLSPGFYDVILTVRDNDGHVDTDRMLLAAAGQCDEWPNPNGALTVESFKIVQNKKSGVTTTSMSGNATLPAIFPKSKVRSRITIELFDVLSRGRDCVLSEEMTLHVTEAGNKLVIGQ
jgi:hypothetical protein